MSHRNVLMLILGGRYGSVEQKSGKSYIQLEYEYAVELGKPHCAMVANEDYLTEKSKTTDFNAQDIFEFDNQDKFKAFKKVVMGKMCNFWSNTDQLSKEIIRSLLDKSENENLTGWIRGDTLFNLNNEIDKLKKENRKLHESLANRGSERYNGLTFDEMYQALSAIKVDLTGIRLDKSAELFFNDICEKIKSEHLNLFHILVHESYFRDESGCTCPQKLDSFSASLRWNTMRD